MRFLPFGNSPGRTHRAHAVVTGAGSGIGRAFAVELARRGGRVVCADKDPITAKESAEMVRQAGGEGFDVVCDVTELEQVRNLADASEDWFGKAASLVINNAGIGAAAIASAIRRSRTGTLRFLSTFGVLSTVARLLFLASGATAGRSDQCGVRRKFQLGAPNGRIQRE